MMFLVLHYINQLTFSSLPFFFFFFPLFWVNPCCSLLLSFLPFKNSSIIGNKCACAPPTFYTCIFTWVIKMIHYLFCHGIFIKIRAKISKKWHWTWAILKNKKSVSVGVRCSVWHIIEMDESWYQLSAVIQHQLIYRQLFPQRLVRWHL